MTTRNYTTAFKLQVVTHYFQHHEGTRATARRFGVSRQALRLWIEHWKASGLAGLQLPLQPRYTAAFRAEVVLWRQQHHASLRKTAATFNIASLNTVRQWERRYNADGIMALASPYRDRNMSKQPQTLVAPYPKFNSPAEELEYLRAENDYLKKLHALAQKKPAPKPR
jgi:transposase